MLQMNASVPPSVVNQRVKTLGRVNAAIKSTYGQQYYVQCFGSTQYGTDSPNSDLDLVVIVSPHLQASHSSFQ